MSEKVLDLLPLQMSDELKNLGNSAFSAGDFEKAVSFFGQAIEIDSNNAVLFSNRSAAYASMKNYDLALVDAEKALLLKPSWSKAYSRKGAALMGLGRYPLAEEAYSKGLELEPENAQLKAGLASVQEFTKENPLKQLVHQILNSPELGHLTCQPDFNMKLRDLEKNPSNLQTLTQDPRFMEAMQLMLGGKMKGNQNDSCGSCDCGHEHEQQHAHEDSRHHNHQVQDHEHQNDSHCGDGCGHSHEQPKQAPKENQEPKQRQQGQYQSSESSARVASDKEKEVGNTFYSSKNFDQALLHYKNALELDPSNFAVYLNLSALYFEQGNFDESIKKAQEAIDLGREHRADYKFIAKALARIGNAFMKKQDFSQAIFYYNKSLTENRDQQILLKLKEAEKAKMIQDKELNYNPAKAEEERNLGNVQFKAGKFAEAIKHYTQAIKHDEKDPKSYSNRAACYQKLNAIPEAQKDCETCLSLDPNFIKAYIRKSLIHLVKKEFNLALECLDHAEKLDSESKHSSEIEQNRFKIYEAMPRGEEQAKNAMKDPEIQQILSDPVMRSILEQMQNDPNAFGEHMKNPLIAAKLKKLISSGVLGTR